MPTRHSIRLRMTSTTFSSRSTVESVWGRIRSLHWLETSASPLFPSVIPMRALAVVWMESVVQSGGLGWSSASLSSSFLEGSCAAASAAAARQSSTASAAAAGGTRATPLPELAEPSFPPKRPSGQHLNIGKIFGTSPGSADLQEKFIQKVTFSPQKKCNFVYKIQYLHTTSRWIYSKSLHTTTR